LNSTQWSLANPRDCEILLTHSPLGVNALPIFPQRSVRFSMEHFLNHEDHERRLIRRHEIKTPLRIRLCKPAGPEQKGESLNLSEYGVCFATDSLLHEGQTVEVMLRMPEEISGEQNDERRCTGRVVRVEPIESPRRHLAISVRFDCYEVTSTKQHRLAQDAKLHQSVTLPIFRRPVN
jgi:hypothetical protein